jgi:iron complex transport system ATP-binding protein
MTHVLMLRDGIVIASGPLRRTLTSANLSECFGLKLTLDARNNGRFSAWAPRDPEVAADPT